LPHLRFLLIFFVLPLSLHAQVLDTVIFKGLTQTSEAYLRGLINCKKGSKFDSLIIKQDEQILNNLNLFFSVQSEWQFNQGNPDHSYSVYFIIEESIYVFPLLSISGFKDVLKIQAGISNINWKGEQKTIGLWYQYYDRHSFSIYHKVPRHKNQKTGHDLIISKYSTLEPLYFHDAMSMFNFDNYSVYFNGRYWLNPRTKVELGFTPIYEVYEQLDDVDINLPDKRFEFIKFRVNTSLTINNLNYKFERIAGSKFELYLETIQTYQFPMASFFMVKTNWIRHYKFKKKGNLSFRHQIGLSTNQDSPFSPFVLDGFLNLRGIGNRVARGTGIHFINLEYRHTVIKNDFFIGQMIGFTDLGSIRPPAKAWTTLVMPNNSNIYSGLGIRIHSQKIYRTILRLDYGVKISDQFNGGFSFGLNQFF